MLGYSKGKVSDSMTEENIENCNSCDTAEKLAELPVLVLAKFSEDLLDMAKENWCESHIIMLRRLIIAVQQGTRYDETLLPEEAGMKCEDCKFITNKDIEEGE